MAIFKTVPSGCEHISQLRPSHILPSNQHWLISSSFGPAAATTVIPIHFCLQELWKQSSTLPMAPITGNISPYLWLHQHHLLSSLFATLLFWLEWFPVLSNVHSPSWIWGNLRKGGCWDCCWLTPHAMFIYVIWKQLWSVLCWHCCVSFAGIRRTDWMCKIATLLSVSGSAVLCSGGHLATALSSLVGGSIVVRHSQHLQRGTAPRWLTSMPFSLVLLWVQHYTMSTPVPWFYSSTFIHVWNFYHRTTIQQQKKSCPWHVTLQLYIEKQTWSSALVSKISVKFTDV